MTPTAIGASSRSASTAIAANTSESAKVITSIVFSGHSTRSRSASSGIERVASRWRSVTSDDGTSNALVPCSPPPCTAAMLSVSPVGCPVGATNESTTTTTTAAKPMTPCGDPEACGRIRRANAGTPTSANPSCMMTQVMRMTPPIRATPRNGPPTWEIPIDASGTPPNGNENRSASASVWAAGRPITRHGPFGAISAATAWYSAYTEPATM